MKIMPMLYLIEILHQTTTLEADRIRAQLLYLIEILHQTTTLDRKDAKIDALYLIEILHQTTTAQLGERGSYCCILSKFYIKPQHETTTLRSPHVVSYRNSTSNHNSPAAISIARRLYLIEILHQTTTITSRA